ncbi:hydroxybutyrate dehydrogenase [Aspergillus sclerotiicarbonarius CBS 121057]|uniref:Hydroxybutyrate dehydrogenase n=1 Tax=Aspergillus sclerotiicarbonarius (strain CBS 121057 / IBT 28362) TaxID=1448318 RepID=A0A319EH05_ASPSB|nr:hydroxybutyrate dehydrogenase [Aspergillus sclerotiicarbonarius CBS 121057]
MATQDKQTWFITGCSSGFGEQFVRQLRALGDNVVATGRNADTKLAHLKDTGATILDLDVTAPQAELNEKFQQAIDIYGGVDVLVNNAGYLQCGAVEELTKEEMERTLDVNFHGPINLTRAALPHFRSKGSQGKGLLIYMSSQSGFYGEPGGSAYCASKFALEGAVESLAKELAWLAPGIKPLLIQPGVFSTEVMNNINHVPHRVEFWRPLNDAARVRGAGNYRNEPGNAVDMIAKVIQIAKGIGIAEGKEIPLRVPFGSYCVGFLREKLREIRQTLDDWEEIARSADYPERQAPMPTFPG